MARVLFAVTLDTETNEATLVGNVDIMSALTALHQMAIGELTAKRNGDEEETNEDTPRRDQ